MFASIVSKYLNSCLPIKIIELKHCQRTRNIIILSHCTKKELSLHLKPKLVETKDGWLFEAINTQFGSDNVTEFYIGAFYRHQLVRSKYKLGWFM